MEKFEKHWTLSTIFITIFCQGGLFKWESLRSIGF